MPRAPSIRRRRRSSCRCCRAGPRAARGGSARSSRGVSFGCMPSSPDQRRELAVDVAPLAHAPVREKMLVQELGQLAVRFLVLERVLEKAPELQIRQEVRALVLKLLLRAVGRVGAVEGRSRGSWIDKRGGDDQHFAQAVLALRGEHHARDARVDRKLRELPADLRELVRLVDRAELGEELVAVGDHARPGGSRNGKSSTSPMRSDFMRRITAASDERRISGSVNSGRAA